MFVSDRRIAVNMAQWDDCLACPEWEDCYKLSVGKVGENGQREMAFTPHANLAKLASVVGR